MTDCFKGLKGKDMRHSEPNYFSQICSSKLQDDLLNKMSSVQNSNCNLHVLNCLRFMISVRFAPWPPLCSAALALPACVTEQSAQ